MATTATGTSAPTTKPKAAIGVTTARQDVKRGAEESGASMEDLLRPHHPRQMGTVTGISAPTTKFRGETGATQTRIGARAGAEDSGARGVVQVPLHRLPQLPPPLRFPPRLPPQLHRLPRLRLPRLRLPRLAHPRLRLQHPDRQQMGTVTGISAPTTKFRGETGATQTRIGARAGAEDSGARGEVQVPLHRPPQLLLPQAALL